MAIDNPFAPLTEQINVLAQQRGSPQNARLQFDLMNAVEEQTRQNLVNDYLATADFAKDPAAAMRTLGTLTNNMDMVRASLDYTLKNRAFEDQRKSLAALAQQQGEFGAFAETLASGGFSPEEQAQLYSRAAGTGLELPGIPAGAREADQSQALQSDLDIQKKRLDIQAKQKELTAPPGDKPLTQQQKLTQIRGLKQEVEKSKPVVEFKQLRRQVANANSALIDLKDKITRGIKQEALILTFQKALDPISVVREGEFARTASGQGLLQRIDSQIQRAIGGGFINDETVDSIQKLINEFAANAQRYANQEIESRREIASSFNLDPDLVGKTFSDFVESQTTEPDTAQPTEMGVTGGAGQPASINDFFKSNPALRQFAK